jgi:ParB-like chromosome segregation protein Spo0J
MRTRFTDPQPTTSWAESQQGLKIEYRSLDDLSPYARNARTHSKQQVRQIAESIRRFGFNVAVLIDARNTIIAGHARVEAAKLLGITEVPTVRWLCREVGGNC